MKSLYKITLRGMTSTFTNSGTTHGIAYVIAKTSEEAYQKHKKFLDENKIGFAWDRELKNIELIAQDIKYPPCGIRLFID